MYLSSCGATLVYQMHLNAQLAWFVPSVISASLLVWTFLPKLVDVVLCTSGGGGQHIVILLVYLAQVPEVVDFSFNMTLGTAQAARAAKPTQFVESVTFPLFLGGERRSRAQWASPGSLPGSMQLAYDASQLQLLCVAEVRNEIPSQC